MLFSSIIFLFYFLPCFFLAYYLTPKRFRNGICLLASLFFYAWGEPYYILLMLGSIVMNYGFGRALRFDRSDAARKRVMILSCVCNLGLLFVFKYTGFFLQTTYSLFGIDREVLSIALPLGISFYTFQEMSYIFDVYRKQVPVQRKLQDLALYVCMFPQLVAGPIVRYEDVNNELRTRTLHIPEIAQGIFRLMVGMGKKVLLSNGLGAIADAAWAVPADERSVVMAWLGLISYTLQIYFDFSGYSDMAIGMGKMMGFHFMENFNYPYISASVTEFWRRWHMSLGSWFRDYVYIPLGGNRVSDAKNIRNLLLVWTLTGFWHGASWTFLLWGLYYGVLICIEKQTGLARSKRLLPLRRVGCVLAVMLGWVLFRSDTIQDAAVYVGNLVGLNGGGLIDAAAQLRLHDNALLLVLAVIGATPLVRNLAVRLEQKLPGTATELLRCGTVVVLLALCTLYLVNSTYNPFIYFRF